MFLQLLTNALQLNLAPVWDELAQIKKRVQDLEDKLEEIIRQQGEDGVDRTDDQ